MDKNRTKVSIKLFNHIEYPMENAIIFNTHGNEAITQDMVAMMSELFGN